MIRLMYSQQQERTPLVPFCDTISTGLGISSGKMLHIYIDKRMQKRHTPRILKSMNDTDLLRGWYTKKSAFSNNWHLVRGPMNFAAN